MNHDDVIRLAREAADPDAVDPLCGSDQRDLITLDLDEMVRFAALVAAHEREACALILDGVIEHLYIYNYDGDASTELRRCAKAIRARANDETR